MRPTAGVAGAARRLLQTKQASTATSRVRNPNANLGVAVLVKMSALSS